MFRSFGGLEICIADKRYACGYASYKKTSPAGSIQHRSLVSLKPLENAAKMKASQTL